VIEQFDTVREQLAQLAPIINSFKSEAVQLRLVELILGTAPARNPTAPTGTPEGAVSPAGTRPRASGGVRRRRKATSSTDAVPSKPRGTSGKVGAGTTLNELIATGYFKQPKLIGDMVAHSTDKLARPHKASDFSPMLVRAVRDKKLVRDKNTQGQYEYKAP
jgi:hypothetical protein